MIDARLLAVAALVASPAAYRSAQGLLSPAEAMTRYLLVAAGCVLVSMLVRAIWPLVSGADAEAQADAALHETGQPVADDVAGLSALDDANSLDGFGGFSAFDDAEPA